MIVRLFYLDRAADISGLSGIGRVADGVQFSDGRVVTCWNGAVSQICVWRSVEEMVSIHGHNGNSRVVWIDDNSRVIDILQSLPQTVRAARLARGISLRQLSRELNLAASTLERFEKGGRTILLDTAIVLLRWLENYGDHDTGAEITKTG